MDLSIRPALPATSLLLAALHAACFRDAWSAASFAALLATPGAFALVAATALSAASDAGSAKDEDAEPVGFIVCRIAADECEVLTLGVLASVRGHGIGGRLLHAAEEVARVGGAQAMFLEVAIDNHPAYALYRRFSYFKVGKRSGYYTSGYTSSVDALVMRHDLCDE